jgi:hypothetical protein
VKPTTASSRRLLRQLGKGPALVEAPSRTGERRDQIVARLGERLRAEQVRAARLRMLTRRLGVLAVAAVALLVVAGAWLAVRGMRATANAVARPAARVAAIEGAVRVMRAGQPIAAPLAADVPLSAPDEVRTGPSGEARVTLSSGAIVLVGHATELRLVPTAGDPGGGEERLELRVGRIELDVPKLGRTRALSVQTAQAAVTVHGTRFSMEVRQPGPGESMATFVDVTEGRVGVVAEGEQVELSAGAHWRSHTHEAKVAAGSPSERELGAASAARQRGVTAADATATPAEAARGPSSTLAEENGLYGAAMAARRSGDDRAVVGYLDLLIASYPRSALLPNARAERIAALERLQAAAASSHPDGGA